jgi:hypothetical protein
MQSLLINTHETICFHMFEHSYSVLFTKLAAIVDSEMKDD